MRPVRFSGSTAARRTVSPERSRRRVWRSASTASGRRVLLADEAGDEAAAARGAARLHAAERPQDFAPGHREALAHREIAEDDTVAREKLLGDRLGEGLDVGAALGLEQRRRHEDRPAALRAHHDLAGAAPKPPAARTRRALGPALAGGQQRAHAAEAVGGDETARDQVPEPLLHLDAEAPGDGDEIVVEQRPRARNASRMSRAAPSPGTPAARGRVPRAAASPDCRGARRSPAWRATAPRRRGRPSLRPEHRRRRWRRAR